ncbi:ankyrin repeat-containing domain protein [Triangularia verruculosa]|uniref:Ankyrin repeat-containing domain protein n=1 Tax=Triangularia verruculosa TaxID=2587418 RepID=A0AAN6XDJ1_9PEZI|nr:ankyrin repeat-containing domain protein [Triangularia verruculosa]
MSGLEAIGVVASIGSLVDIADRAFRASLKYIRAVKDAPKTARLLTTEIQNICGVLHSLKVFSASLEDEQLVGSDTKALHLHHIDSCCHTLTEIRLKLEKYQNDFNSGHKRKTISRSLKWPFSEEETTKLLNRVSADKQTMSLAMTVDSTSAFLLKLSRQHQDVTRQMAEIHSDARTTLEISARVEMNSKRRAVLALFNRSEAQASEYLAASVASRFPMTALWLTQGDKFKDWLCTPRSKLWLGGIAGAGKTVIAGAMISQALSLCNPECAVAFFFCDVSKGAATSLTDLFGTLAAQLARQSEDAYQTLERYYSELNPERGVTRAATVDRLGFVLAEMIGCFTRVYIVIDGLDEYGQEATKIITTLSRIWDSTETCSIALLSRDEAYIREELEDELEFEYLEVAARKEDIEPYVIAKIEEKFRKGKKKREMMEETKEAITNALVAGSGGMFRWVVCQIDYIAQFSSDADRRKALNDLPPDLTETYKRILDGVNENTRQDVQTLVKRILHLIDFNEERITIPQLSEAISTHISRPEDLVSEDDIALWCSGLIRKSSDGTYFEFAHFSVREFLRSDKLLGTAYDRYHTSDAKVAITLASTSIQFLLRPEFSPVRRNNDLATRDAIARVKAHPFYSYAAKFWTTAQDKSWWDDSEVNELLLRLFQNPKTGNCTNWTVEVCRNLLLFSEPWYNVPMGPPRYNQSMMTFLREHVVSTTTRADFTPLHIASLLSIPSVTKHLLSLKDPPVDSSSPVGTPLHCATIGTLLFDESQSALSTISRGYWTLKFDVMGSSAKASTVKLLLEAGANPSEVCHTKLWSHSPLYVSFVVGTGSLGFTLFLQLLKAGASIDKNTYEHALELFHSNVEVEEEAAVAGLKALLEGILKATTATKSLEQAAALRLQTAALKFISDAKANFNFDSSAIGFAYGSGPDATALSPPSKIKIAIKSGNMDAVRHILNTGTWDWAHQKLEDGRTLLHYSVIHGASDVLRLLVAKGLDINFPDEEGNTAVTLCHKKQDVPMLQELLIAGGRSDVAETKKGNTVWHLAAASSSAEILELLVDRSGEDAISALSRRNNLGETPFAAALAFGAVRSANFILSRFKGVLSCFASDSVQGAYRPYRLATQMTISAELINLMAKACVPLDPVTDDGDTPLHYLKADKHGPLFASSLKRLYPSTGRRGKDNKTPLELFLLSFYSHPTDPIYETRAWDTIRELCEEPKSLDGNAAYSKHETTEDTEQRSKAFGTRVSWPSLEDVIPSALDCALGSLCGHCASHLHNICEFFLDTGAMAEFELGNGFSGLIPLLSCFRVRDSTMRLEHGISHAQVPLHRAIEETKYWESARNHRLVFLYLRRAVFYNLTSDLQFLLSNGMDVQAQVGGCSALAQACTIQSQCSTFEKVLDFADPIKLNDTVYTSPEGDLRLIHILAYDDGPISNNKLKALIRKGADVNGKTAYGLPAMSLYIQKRASQGAQILLAAGANVNLQDRYGWDSLAIAATMNDISFLRKVKTMAETNSVEIDWRQTSTTCILRRGTFKGSHYNALHIAIAGSTSSEIPQESIQFYLEGGYFDNSTHLTGEGFSYMHLAAMAGHADLVRLLGSHEITAQTVNWQREGLLPLNIAIDRGNAELVKALLEAGADKTAIGRHGYTPTVYAMVNGMFDIAEILAPSTKPIKYDDRRTAREGLIRKRLALEDAIRSGEVLTCKSLLEEGCPLNMPLIKCRECSPLLLALQEEKNEVVMWMVQSKTDLDILARVCQLELDTARFTCVPVLAARSVKNLSALPMILTAYLRAGGMPFLEEKTPLHAAADGKNHEGICVIVRHIKKNRNLYQTAHSSFLDGCDTADGVMRRLVNAKTFYPDGIKRTALHIAVMQRSVETVGELLNNQADPNQQDQEGDTPVHVAVRDKFIDLSIIRQLLKAGALLEIRNKSSFTPLLLAAYHSRREVVEILLEHGANPYAQLQEGISVLGLSQDPSIFDLFLRRGLDPSHIDQYGSRPIHLGLGRASTRRMILNRLDIQDIPPLKNASFQLWHHGNILNLLRTINLIAKRQSHLGCPNVAEFKPQQGKSPLYFAAEYGDLGAIRSILKAGAEIDFENSSCNGRTALLVACSYGRFEVVKYLVGRGAALCYNDLTNTPQSALRAAQRFPDIIHWLLVERFRERKRLKCSNTVYPANLQKTKVSPWSGLWAAQFRLAKTAWDWKGRDFADFAHRNTQWRRYLAGHVVSGVVPIGPSDEVERP